MISEIVKHFNIDGDLIEYNIYGSGHINNTYLVLCRIDGKIEKYIFRKINSSIFKKPEFVVENAVYITNHIRQKLENQNEKNIHDKVLTFKKTRDNKYFYSDKNGEVWTVNLFFDSAYTVDFVSNEVQAYNAAKAFGNFQKLLIDIDTTQLKTTLPDFHNWEKRRIDFLHSINKDIQRTEKASEEISFLTDEKYQSIITNFNNLLSSGELPVRITHNDTKINNVMLSKKSDEPMAVIDLDTVMPGSLLYDFGDMVRSFCSPVPEDEKDRDKIKFRVDIFRALTDAYLSEVRDFITPGEVNNLIAGAELLIYVQAIRFLTDFLQGDIYYKTAYEDHNLVRTRNQIALLQSLFVNKSKLNEILEELKSKHELVK